MTFTEFILCCKIARALHGTDNALRHTARQCRDRVSIQNRPLLSRLMRHDKIGKWLDAIDSIHNG